jgi:TetR/AcrR family transcriptional regulator, transcriptional repressor for nem operon
MFYICKPTGRFVMKNTKGFIIEKAFSLFMIKSYKEVILSEILKATGLSKGAFYHHFESKEALFEAVVDQFFFGIASDGGFEPAPEKSFIENMDEFLLQKEKAFAWFASQLGVDQSEINFFMFIMEAIRHLPTVKHKVGLFMQQEKMQLERIVEMAQQKGELKGGTNISAVAAMLQAAFDGLELHGVLLRKSAETTQKEKELVLQIYDCIRN